MWIANTMGGRFVTAPCYPLETKNTTFIKFLVFALVTVGRLEAVRNRLPIDYVSQDIQGEGAS